MVDEDEDAAEDDCSEDELAEILLTLKPLLATAAGDAPLSIE